MNWRMSVEKWGARRVDVFGKDEESHEVKGVCTRRRTMMRIRNWPEGKRRVEVIGIAKENATTKLELAKRVPEELGQP